MAEKQQTEDVSLTMQEAEVVLKRGIRLDKELQEALEAKGAVFRRGRAGADIPFSALVSLGVVKDGADPHEAKRIVVERKAAAKAGGSPRRPSPGVSNAVADLALAEEAVRKLEAEEGDLIERLAQVQTELKDAKKVRTVARGAAKREQTKADNAAKREQVKAKRALEQAEAAADAANAKVAALRKQAGK